MASAVLAIVIVSLRGTDALWLHARVVWKLARLGLVIGCGAGAYFAVLFALGFRLADFNRRDALEPPDAPAPDGE